MMKESDKSAPSASTGDVVTLADVEQLETDEITTALRYEDNVPKTIKVDTTSIQKNKKRQFPSQEDIDVTSTPLARQEDIKKDKKPKRSLKNKVRDTFRNLKACLFPWRKRKASPATSDTSLTSAEYREVEEAVTLALQASLTSDLDDLL